MAYSEEEDVQEYADVIDLQVTGPAEELKALEETFAPFNPPPTFYTEI
jgi:hypothetical protein